MKRIFGSIPIIAAIVLLFGIAFGVVGTPQKAEGAAPSILVLKANPVPGFDVPAASDINDINPAGGAIDDVDGDGNPDQLVRASGWANFNTVLRVVVTDADVAGGGVAPPATGIIVTLESDEFDSGTDVIAPFNVGETAADTGRFIFEIGFSSTGPSTAGISTSTVPFVGAGNRPVQHVDDEDEFSILIQPVSGAGVTLTIDNAISRTINIENDKPDISGVTPEHEDVVDDTDVDIFFEYTDDDSGIPDPEDKPDSDNDDEYTTAVILISAVQCTDAQIIDLTTVAAILAADCDGGGADISVITIPDEDDFDDVDDGFEVDTSAFFAQDVQTYFTVLVFDRAGNFDVFDGDDTDSAVALNEITVDETDPAIDLIRTGVTWDAADDEYDDDRSYVQVIMQDLTDLDPDSIDEDDFVVEGHTVRRVQWFDLDPEEIAGGPDSNSATEKGPLDIGVRGETSAVCTAGVAQVAGGVSVGDVVGCDGNLNPAGDDDLTDAGEPYPAANIRILRPTTWGGNGAEVNNVFMIRNSVFIQLEDELDPDEEMDINIVPDGIDDEAGNSQDSDDDEAEDWIAPGFTLEEITSPRQTGEDEEIAGENDEVEIIIRSDEDLDDDPDVTVTFVNAFLGCQSGGQVTISTDAGAPANCANSATGGELTASVREIGTNRWRVTIDEPDDTGYYNIFIFGDDENSNTGDEGIEDVDIRDDFFETDGDVNTDDAIFFEGDLRLPNPRVLIAGEDGRDEPAVEFRNPFFIQLDFTVPHQDDCTVAQLGTDEEDCLAEDDEYEEDNFSEVIVTLFELDGIDLTDLVSTTDDETFLIAVENIAIGDHEIVIQAVDLAGNELEDELEIDFEVEARDPFERELQPGWNLMSIPGEPVDPSIDTVFGPDVAVTTVYTFDPTVPGGWLVAVRETPDDPWVGDLTEINAHRGFWTLADEIQNLEVDIPRLAGGAANGGTPIQPPTIDLFPGWNLVPLVDVTGEVVDEDFFVDADQYFASGDDEVARILTYNTVTNQWETVPFDNDPTNSDGVGTALDDLDLQFGRAYWVFAIEGITIVPGGDLLE